MAELFRKTVLERLSSPEQLDKMIVITPPSFWLALSGAGLIVSVGILWSIFGKLPTSVETTGIYMSQGGNRTVYADYSGIVEEIEVKEGDLVERGQTIAYLSDTELQDRIKEYETRIECVKSVTMDSKDDVVTTDNKVLIELKEQMLTVNQSLRQSQASLEARMGELAAQRKKTSEQEQILLAKEKEYYDSLSVGNDTNEQLNYTEAQTNYSTASQYLETYQTNLDSAQVTYAQLKNRYYTLKNTYDQCVEQKSAYEQEMERIEQEIESTQEEEEKKQKQEQLALLKAEYDEFLASGAIENAESNMKAAKIEMDAAKSTVKNYQSDVNEYTDKKNQTEKAYAGAKEMYMNKAAEMARNQIRQSQVYNEYSTQMSSYSTEKGTLASLEDAVKQLQVQVETEQANVEENITYISSQFQATKESVLDGLNREMKGCQAEQKKTELKSTVSGVISDIMAAQGTAMAQGSGILKVKEKIDEENIVILYVPVQSGKKIREGMEVLIYPTTVNKQEYGHMSAKVESVDDYVSSSYNLQEQLGSEELMNLFMQNGPVVAVRCVLDRDVHTASGYSWSSRKGAELVIEEGTLVEANVVIEEKAPITKLIPYLKEKFTIKVGEENR